MNFKYDFEFGLSVSLLSEVSMCNLRMKLSFFPLQHSVLNLGQLDIKLWTYELKTSRKIILSFFA